MDTLFDQLRVKLLRIKSVYFTLDEMLTFQEIIRQLKAFWGERGCVIHEPYDVEVGAGTFNPASFLRCLGPEPYSCAYVESSRRPQDGRYGQNPNRFHQFHQFQVVIKPSPLDIQDTFIKSLEVIGFDLKEHDIRFVHDDWESPTLGAWGLGWEVWIDGMECTQYTYFQAAGGIPSKPVCIELAYGLERLAMLVQNVDSFLDIQWNETLTFRDIALQSEVEWSQHNFEAANVEMWGRHFDDFEKEANALVEKKLPLPAYDSLLKATHAFNILETRGVLSVTERTGVISRLRNLTALIAKEYIHSREVIDFPLLKETEKKEHSPVQPLLQEFSPEQTSDFLLEIGSEQLPATFVPIGMRNLEKAIKNILFEHHLAFSEIQTFGTPRRLAILVKDLVHGTAPITVEKKGPPLNRAFDEIGTLTPQGKGFFASLGIERTLKIEDVQNILGIEVRTVGKHDYLFAKVEKEGVSTIDLLQKELPGCITALSFPKKMRWSDLNIEYARPLRWIVAIHGETVIPFELAGILSSNNSFGHAQRAPEPFEIDTASSYNMALKNHYVLVDVEERRNEILRQLTLIEKNTDSIALKKARVLGEVLHLVEWPELTEENYDEAFLKAPAEVLISEMVEHQRYFPLADEHGALKNQFVITADNHPGELVRKGNQKVLSARLSDGVFLYEQDLKHPLDHYVEKLKSITFQKQLGSVYDKMTRLRKLSEILSEFIPGTNADMLKRAATLCKADLSTQLVYEFPELQGVIGKDYALVGKEEREVAEAIEEHWLPKSEGGPLPKSLTGSILALADKFDNLIGYYSVGIKPTSSSDPYALRRATLGIIKILIENKWSINLTKLLDRAYTAFPKLHGEINKQTELTKELQNFITSRARTVYEDYGFQKDEIEASLGSKSTDPYDQYKRIEALSKFRKSGDDFSKLFEVYKRAKGQLHLKIENSFDTKLLQESQEKTLAKEIDSIEKHWNDALVQADYTKAFELLSSLHIPLADLFNHVKILAEDTSVRDNRLALLQKVFNYFSELLDFSKIQEK